MRTIETTTRLNDYLDWPDVGCVCRLERVVRRDGAETREVEYAITSAGPEEAAAAEVLSWWRGHWGIENRRHWVRDVTLGEDASRTRTGGAPGVMAGCGTRRSACGGCPGPATSPRHCGRTSTTSPISSSPWVS